MRHYTFRKALHKSHRMLQKRLFKKFFFLFYLSNNGKKIRSCLFTLKNHVIILRKRFWISWCTDPASGVSSIPVLSSNYIIIDLTSFNSLVTTFAAIFFNANNCGKNYTVPNKEKRLRNCDNSNITTFVSKCLKIISKNAAAILK